MTSECSAYHVKLTVMLEAQSNIKQINEARHADGQEQVSKPDDDPHLMG